MIYTGKITDTTGKPIPGAMVVFRNDAGQNITAIQTTAAGAWSLDSDFDNGLLVPGMQVIFAAPGYSEYGISPSALQQSFNVTLQKKITTILPWMVAAVLGAVLIVMNTKKKGKSKVGAINNNDLTTIFLLLGGIIAFTVIKKILESVGIWTSPEKKKLQSIAIDPNSFWTPTYWQNINPGGSGWTYALTEEQAQNLLSQIKSAFGLFTDSPEKVMAAFRTLQTKANVSFLAWELQKTDGADLLELLRNGGGILPWDGLSDSDTLAINDYINSLPNY